LRTIDVIDLFSKQFINTEFYINIECYIVPATIFLSLLMIIVVVIMVSYAFLFIKKKVLVESENYIIYSMSSSLYWTCGLNEIWNENLYFLPVFISFTLISFVYCLYDVELTCLSDDLLLNTSVFLVLLKVSGE